MDSQEYARFMKRHFPGAYAWCAGRLPDHASAARKTGSRINSARTFITTTCLSYYTGTPAGRLESSFFSAIIRSWAATWPFLATLCLSIFVFLCFRFAPLNVKASPQDKKAIDIQSTNKEADKSINVSNKQAKDFVKPEKISSDRQ